ncbi:hypothetical protein BCV69DRAFT_283141 [Microstroma glucosiphilum]|uniref:Uncharacterized protein n=1 Tax=Pseudomicrostroma glucosiphilum TaxID=1684307 RepID=A0A316U4V9_9BASI|nr:hypothetical protein BCV69DRAFT_283141 [Pseudomicrostroma glucosiphilum]PWN20266.1 hypothetical protein BCV69DRAFT_283141 [Pseudomicrostroma glucosiphilum]
MRFSILLVMLAALPLLAMGATRGPSTGLTGLARRQGAGNDGCYPYEDCDPSNEDCYKGACHCGLKDPNAPPCPA